MKKRVFIIHGWEGYPEEGWFPWLKEELEKKDFEVFVPQMPNTEEPKIEEWVSFLGESVGIPDENTYFVGHSIGCQAIIRYLETLDNKKIGGVVFVAGWFDLTEFTYKEEPQDEDDARSIAEPWIKTPIDFENIKKTTNNLIAIFSDNDPYVSIDNANKFKEKLDARIIVEKNKMHFRGTDGFLELPIVLEKILEISN